MRKARISSSQFSSARNRHWQWHRVTGSFSGWEKLCGHFGCWSCRCFETYGIWKACPLKRYRLQKDPGSSKPSMENTACDFFKANGLLVFRGFQDNFGNWRDRNGWKFPSGSPPSSTGPIWGEGYTLFSPMAGEISFDVDISQVPAGMCFGQLTFFGPKKLVMKWSGTWEALINGPNKNG